MKVRREGKVNHHFRPESWAYNREGVGQALTGVRVAGLLSTENTLIRGAEAMRAAEGKIRSTAKVRGRGAPRCLRTQART